MIPDADAEAEVVQTEGEIDVKKGRWGIFRFTHVKRAKYGGYEVSCPYHRLSDKSGCVRTLYFADG